MRPAKLIALLSTALPAAAFAQEVPAPAPQPAPAEAPLPDDEGEDGATEIVVTGARQRGAVQGDIPPELQLSPRDIRSFGASNIAELLTQLAPQTRSGRGRDGGGPVVLVNGQRISGFGEIRDLPPEAIERVDILPEEVALRYGFAADQRVINFVLRPRFRAITGEVEYGVPTAGGRSSYELDFNILRIGENGRWTLDAEVQRDTSLLESERDFDGPLADARTLLPNVDQATVSGSINRRLSDTVSGTLTGRFSAVDTSSLFGLQGGSILVPGGNPFNTSGVGTTVPVTFGGLAPLGRENNARNLALGLTVNGSLRPWQWNLTANYERADVETRTDVGPDLGIVQARVAAGDPALNPFAGIDSALARTRVPDRAETLAQTANANLLLTGPLFSLPAGEVSTSIRAGGELRRLSGFTIRLDQVTERSLGRDRLNGQISLDVPIASRRRDILPLLGNLSLNLNAAFEELSDFGTLRTLGAGINWSPIEPLSLIASYTDEDGAPTIQQLGEPSILTPNVRVFDFVRGQTVDIARLEGGNPALLADNRRVLRLGFTLQPFGDTPNISLTGNYVRTRIDNPIAAFPTATPEIEAAFPDRFTRDADGTLLRIDSRPVNFARSDRKEVRWGINFLQQIGPQGGASGPGGFRRGGRGGGQEGGAGQGAGQGVGQGAGQGGGRGFGGGGRGGRGGFGGGGFGGRGGGIQLALFHNWRLQDTVLIREGVPELDFLNGSAFGSRGGRPEHEVELQAGIFRNGLGARLSGSWQSGTFVRGLPGAGGTGGSDLFFSDIATFNLRLFANLGQQRALRGQRWLRGARVTLAVDNIFDARPEVTDANGVTPTGYLPDYLDPLGRTVRISFRKLFF